MITRSLSTLIAFLLSSVTVCAAGKDLPSVGVKTALILVIIIVLLILAGLIIVFDRIHLGRQRRVNRITAENLNTSEELIKLLFEEIPAAFCLVDHRGLIKQMSKNFGKLLGIEIDNTINTPLENYIDFEQDDERASDGFLQLVQLSETGPVQGRYRNHSNDENPGDAFTISIAPAKSATSPYLVVLDHKSDFQVEENGKSDDIWQVLKNRLPEDFAHDIRTPLNAIIGFSQILHNRAGKENYPVDILEMLNNIRRSGQELTLSVNSLIETIKPGSTNLTGQHFNPDYDDNADSIETPNYSRSSKILVVEDNPVNQDLMRTFFHDLGLEITSAMNGLEGVDKANELLPDLVFMDIRMPKMGGLKAIEQIRDNPRTKSLPVIALSADTAEEKKQEALQAGFSDYLTKPFDLDDLYPFLNRHLKKVRVGDQEIESQTETIPDEVRNRLDAAFGDLSLIPKDYSNALLEALEKMKSLVQPYKSNLPQVLQEIETAVYECDDDKIDRLIKEQLNLISSSGL